MGVTIEEFVSKIRWDTDSRGLQSFENSVEKVGKAVLAVSAAVVAGTTALIAFAGVTARNEAIQTNLATAVGMSAEKVEALATVFNGLGFDFEKTIDLTEELNNKMGEFELTGMTSVKEALQLVNLEFKDLKDLAPEEQLIKVLDAAKALGDSQVAASAVDMLMGGDANKMIGYLRTYEGSLEDIISLQLKMNLRTEESRAGAVRFADALNNLGSIWESAAALGSGLVGKALSPLIEKFNTWIAANRELVQSKIDDFIQGLTKVVKALYRAFVFLAPKVSWFFGKIADGVKAVGGFGAVLRIAGLLLAQLVATKVITGLVKIVQLVKAGRTAAMLFSAAWFLVPIVLALVAEDIYQFVKGNDSLIGEMVDGFKVHYAKWVELTEGAIGVIVKDIAAGFGATEQDAQKFLLSIEDWIDGTINFIVEANKVGFAALSELFYKVKDVAVSVFSSVSSTVNSAIESIKNGIMKVVGLVRKIPGLGNFGSFYLGATSGEKSVEGPRHSFPTPTIPQPSAAVTRATSNNNEQTLNVTNNVTQQAGESGEVFADRVTEGLNKAAASIKRNLGSGLAY